MTKAEWPFSEEFDVMVLTTKNITNLEDSIKLVSHDSEDGMWQFHVGSDVNMEDAMLVSLKEIYSIDNTIGELSDLPLGWIAWRDDNKDSWKRQKE